MVLFITSSYWALPVLAFIVVLFVLQRGRNLVKYSNLYLTSNLLLVGQTLFFPVMKNFAPVLMGLSTFVLIALMVSKRYLPSSVRKKLLYKLPLLGMLLFYTIFRYAGEVYVNLAFAVLSLLALPLAIKIKRAQGYYIAGVGCLLVGSVMIMWKGYCIRDICWMMALLLLSFAGSLVERGDEVGN